MADILICGITELRLFCSNITCLYKIFFLFLKIHVKMLAKFCMRLCIPFSCCFMYYDDWSQGTNRISLTLFALCPFLIFLL